MTKICKLFVILLAFIHVLAMQTTVLAAETSGDERGKEIEELQERFGWWPTDAKPGAVYDAERGGYWWMPTEPGEARPWGNRGYIYVYKIIFDYQSDDLPAPKLNELRPSLLIRKITKNIKIYFDYDSASLREDTQKIFESAVRTMKHDDKTSLLITGNADIRGTEQYNLTLARDRADAVRQYMLRHGIDDERIRIVSQGKLNAVAPVTDLVGMQKDRNAQFMIAEVDEVMIPYQQRPGDKVTPIGENKLKVERTEVVESDIKVSTRTYIVKEGDTLSKISEAELGSAYRWEYLYEINKDRIGHPDQLKPGTKIIIPVE